MFGISTPCAHDWEDEYKAIHDMEVANLKEQIESKVNSSSTDHNETQSQSAAIEQLPGDHAAQNISAGDIARRINSVTKATTRVATLAEEDEEDEKALLAKLAAIRIEKKRKQAALSHKQGTSKPRQTESSPAQCTHVDAENNTVTMTNSNPTIKVSDLMSVSQIRPE